VNLRALILLGLSAVAAALAQKPENVLVVANDSSPLSRSVAEYYARRRGVPLANVCRIRASTSDEITRTEYDVTVAGPLARCLSRGDLHEKILFIVTTAGVPLRIAGTEGLKGNVAAVDSELTLLYSDTKGERHPIDGHVPNPYYGRRDFPEFRHPLFPIYLVTRLAGYDFPDIRGLVDRARGTRNRGRFVFDLKSGPGADGDAWLFRAAEHLPAARVVLESTTHVLYGQKDVIGYAGWGSNDANRHKRFLNFQWLPGAIMTEYVSTNARTFNRPPASWVFGNWKDRSTWFAGSPQSLTADYIHEGVTGASGHVAEPFLGLNARPDILFPAYYAGRTLAESYYLSIPGLSWQNVVIGDPLCVLKR
jgi:uncharacterized protein (TIGR03790 family)